MLNELIKIREELQDSGFFESDFYKVYDRAFKWFNKAHRFHWASPEAASFALNQAVLYAETGQSDFL